MGAVSEIGVFIREVGPDVALGLFFRPRYLQPG